MPADAANMNLKFLAPAPPLVYQEGFSSSNDVFGGRSDVHHTHAFIRGGVASSTSPLQLTLGSFLRGTLWLGVAALLFGRLAATWNRRSGKYRKAVVRKARNTDVNSFSGGTSTGSLSASAPIDDSTSTKSVSGAGSNSSGSIQRGRKRTERGSSKTSSASAEVGCDASRELYATRHNIDTLQIAPGLDEGVVKKISEVNEEPEWLLGFREKAFRWWKEQTEMGNLPEWGKVAGQMPENMEDMLQNLSMFSRAENLGDAVPSVEGILGLNLGREGKVAVDAVVDSRSVATTRRKELYEKYGIIFCSLLEASRDYPDLVQKYLGSVVPINDNYYAALNSAVFSDGTFVYVPPGMKCPIELSTYFRINNTQAGQFERTLIIADTDASVSYIEGCTAAEPPPPAKPVGMGKLETVEPQQMHAAVVELVALGDNSQIKYSTAQNWHTGSADSSGKWSGGVLNLVTKRGQCRGRNSRITWTQVESGSAVTWKYPSCVLIGEGSVGEFYSVALTSDFQEADTGTKMIHIGDNTKSRIISKSISSGHSKNTYRGMVKFGRGTEGCKNYSKCDALLVGDDSTSSTLPLLESGGCDDENDSTEEGQILEHEASTSRVSEDQLQYLMSRGLQASDVLSLLLVGFCSDVFSELPLEFAAEAGAMLKERLRGTVG